MAEDNRPFRTFSEYLGDSATNNAAESSGMVRALAFLIEFTMESTAGTVIRIRSDSQLVVEQINGRWKVRDQALKAFSADCQAHVSTLLNRGCTVIFEHMRRDENWLADRLCNQAFDAVPE